MPLSSLGESGHCELYANNVYFFMTYGGHRIRCGITDLALEILEPGLNQTAKGRLAAFDAHRAYGEHKIRQQSVGKGWHHNSCPGRRCQKHRSGMSGPMPAQLERAATGREPDRKGVSLNAPLARRYRSQA